MKQTADDSRGNHDSSQPQGAERRQCKRLNLMYPIEVSGCDSAGQPFCDRTLTNDVSDRGCRFNLMREVRCGVVLMIQLVPRDGKQVNRGEPLRFEVVWVVASDVGWAIGAYKLQQDNIWHMTFPHKDASTDSTP